MKRLVPGQTLAGRFELLRPLGRGGSGEVWLAQSTAPGSREVAIKVLDDGVGEAGIQAASLARRLVHPNIVRTLEVLPGDPAADIRPAIVMEYVAGDTLAALRGAGHRDIVAAALEVAEALQYAHAQGVIHRDLKPANVLRDHQGHCRVSDFGLALTGGGSLSGASPQQLDGAAPSTADDLYGFGALLYDLLAGQPPFHPGITAGRIRDEVPQPLGVDGRGEAIPPTLCQLVAALLEKSPARRPAGMGAVRVVLEDVQAGDRKPMPVPPWSGAAATDHGAAFPGGPPSAPGQGRRAGERPSRVTQALLFLLVAAAAGVIFYLPTVVRERGPLVVAPAETPATPAATDGAPAPDPRAQADGALARYRQEEQAALAAGLERWASAALAGARQQAATGEQRYQNRDFAGAAVAWDAAAASLAGVRATAPEKLAAAVAAGDQALAAGNQAAAVSAYETALQVDPGHAPAAAGLARARRLDQVLAAMAAATSQENAGDLAAAAQGYQAALKLDPAWAPAREGLDRIQGQQSRARYEDLMAQGLGDLAAGRFESARRAFDGALGLRPGDAAAQDGLRQLAAREQGDRLGTLRTAADQQVAAEDWDGAVASYRSMLDLDPALVSAREGLARAEARANLDRRLKRQLASSDRLNDDAVARQAQALLAEARGVASPGPVLAGQVAELTRQLAVSATTVPVRFESDNLTTVTILKVGSLGTFDARTVELKPGAYTVTGTREGYRDVRRTIRVGADGAGGPVVLRCEEPI